MATAHTRLMTFAEFEQLPEPKGSRYELHRGELVTVAPPKLRHSIIQQKLNRLLNASSLGLGSAFTELGVRPIADQEFRYTDVAWATKERWAQQDPHGYFTGAPDLVIEVLSPPNTTAEIFDKKALCLENGAREFWVVDIDHQRVEVSTPDGHAITYKSGQKIPLCFHEGTPLTVDEIFT